MVLLAVLDTPFLKAYLGGQQLLGNERSLVSLESSSLISWLSRLNDF